MEKKVFSFDLGSGSIGECVRVGEKILHLESLILPNDFASIKELRDIRRAYRTRISHKNRETWWEKCAKIGGLEVLNSSQPTKKNPELKPDERLLREFPKKGDETIYTSCLLRIKLLEGEKLESWQIYKAIRNAFQHRGYDKDVPWAKKMAKKANNKDEEEAIKKALTDYERELENFDDENKYPCYLEAYNLGLWDKDLKKIKKIRIEKDKKNIRNKQFSKKQLIIPRSMIEKELRILLDNARKFFPLLPDTNYILYGESGEPYSSYNNPGNKKYEMEGILGQKVPRFDNRCVGECSLIPRFKVCKADDILNKEVVFLLSLLNLRFFDEKFKDAQLEPEDLKNIFEKYHEVLLKKSKTPKNIIGKKDLKKEIEKLGGKVREEQSEIPFPKIAGRARFSRPALKILKELILSGKNPHDFYNEKILKITNLDPKKGLIKEDYSFLLCMPPDWKKIHIPDDREEIKEMSLSERKEKINDILNKITNPIVKHRLMLFLQELEKLEKKHGVPDEVVIELAREDFLGEKGKKEYIKNQNENKKNIDNAKEKLEKYGKEINDTNILKVRLLLQQNYKDVYDLRENNEFKIEEEESKKIKELDKYEIDHIVPVSTKGGADSFVNKVITKIAFNREKGDKIPYEFFSTSSENWEKYIKHLKYVYGDVKKIGKKYELLTRSDVATEGIEKNRNDLNATSYIEKLAKKIVSLYFGFGDGVEGEKRKIFVMTGGMTAFLRKDNKLDKLLYDSEDEFKEFLKKGNLNTKNRGNKRHHALDALVISFANELENVKDEKQKGKKIFPSFVCEQNPYKYFKYALDTVYPEQIRKEKLILRETIYGLRSRIEEDKKEHYYMCSKHNFKESFTIIKDNTFEKVKKKIENIFDYKFQKDLKEKIDNLENLSGNARKEEWNNFVKDYIEKNKIYRILLIESLSFTEKEVLDKSGIIGEYKEMGKMKGQYFMGKEGHRGQIIYKEKNKWKVEPIYVFESEFKKEKEYKEKYGEKFHDIYHSGETLILENGMDGSIFYNIKEDTGEKNKKGEPIYKNKEKRKKSKIIEGKYKLNTLMSDGSMKITNLSTGKRYSTNITNFLEIGKGHKEYKKISNGKK